MPVEEITEGVTIETSSGVATPNDGVSMELNFDDLTDEAKLDLGVSSSPEVKEEEDPEETKANEKKEETKTEAASEEKGGEENKEGVLELSIAADTEEGGDEHESWLRETTGYDVDAIKALKGERDTMQAEIEALKSNPLHSEHVQKYAEALKQGVKPEDFHNYMTVDPAALKDIDAIKLAYKWQGLDMASMDEALEAKYHLYDIDDDAFNQQLSAQGKLTLAADGQQSREYLTDRQKKLSLPDYKTPETVQLSDEEVLAKRTGGWAPHIPNIINGFTGIPIKVGGKDGVIKVGKNEVAGVVKELSQLVDYDSKNLDRFNQMVTDTLFIKHRETLIEKAFELGKTQVEREVRGVPPEGGGAPNIEGANKSEDDVQEELYALTMN